MKIHIPSYFRPEKIYGTKDCSLPLTLKEMILISHFVCSFWYLLHCDIYLLYIINCYDTFVRQMLLEKEREERYNVWGKNPQIHNPDVINSSLSGTNPAVESQFHAKLGQKILFDHKTCFKIQQSSNRSDTTWITGILNTEKKCMWKYPLCK